MASNARNCTVLAAALLVLIAVTGPIYAFFIMSCVSTRACNYGIALSAIGASCLEGSQRAEQMLHGQSCSLQCPPGYEPSQDSVTCNDGVVDGIEAVYCRFLPLPDTRDMEGGLVTGAITTGELATACRRAASLPCDARAGGSAILLRLSGVSPAACNALLAECEEKNVHFKWAQHQEERNGTCTLGCYGETVQAVAQQPSERPSVGVFQQISLDSAARPTCTEGPICMELAGSCNAGDDGDYYRHPYCASLQTQWVQQDGSHRLRFDGTPESAQAGAWVLERGANAMTDFYGTELARQPGQGLLPRLGMILWNARCLTRINAVTDAVDRREVDITLAACSCTSERDCSGHGQAVGSKDLGPNCRCLCDKGWGGAHCQLKLCLAQAILHAQDPPCEEGYWLTPGTNCTPRCDGGFKPLSPSYSCVNGLLQPSVFKCEFQQAVGNGEDAPDVAQPLTPPPDPGPCTLADCAYHGKPMGSRQRDGSCVCECDEGWGGADCRTIIGNCPAPRQADIANAEWQTCVEGRVVPTTCTAQCNEGYRAYPPTLACTGVALSPSTFKCFGGPTTMDTWCVSMRYISLGTSAVSAAALVMICFLASVGRARRPEGKSYEVGPTQVVVEKDADGAFNLVRGNADIRSQLPEHINNTVQPAIFEPASESPTSAGGLRALADAPDDMAIVESIESPPELPGQPESALQEGHEVFVTPAEARQELQGLKGTLFMEERDPGFWLVALEGQEGYTRMHETALALPAPPPVPEECGETQEEWLMELYQRDQQARLAEQRQQAAFASQQQRAEAERLARLQRELDETEAEREDIEAIARDGLRLGDVALLRESLRRGKVVLERLKGASAGSTTGLARVMEVVESRLEQHDEREAARERKRLYDERVEKGLAADWKMTKEDFWRHVQRGDLEKVRAGLKAQLSVQARTQDRLRLSLAHVGCSAMMNAEGEQLERHLQVLKELLAARAGANALDMEGRTPLDLALSQGDKDSAVAKALQGLGFRTAQEAAKEPEEAAKVGAQAAVGRRFR